MRAEIISIGTELLIGSIINTNARYLAEKMAQSAIDVYHQVTVGDNVNRLVEALETAAGRSDIIITSGGLGPTEDDVTLQGILRFTGQPALFHKPTYRHISERLRKSGLKISKLGLRQCYVPKNSTVFKNNHGAAPGILCRIAGKTKNTWILSLPGPPGEMEPMFENQVLPVLLKRARVKPEHFLVRTIKISGLTETQVAQKIPGLLKSKPPLTTGIYAKPGLVTLKIMAKSCSKVESKKMAARAESILRKKLGKYIFGTDEGTLSSAVGNLLSKNKKTLAVAESCTGGLLGSLVTDTPGSSSYFLGGIIAYDDRVKSRELGIDKESLKKYGAVSPQTAAGMAKNVQKKFNADYGIGITGIAGPGGGTRNKPVGLVYIALASEKTNRVKNYIFRGSRHEIKSRAAHQALNILRLYLSCTS